MNKKLIIYNLSEVSQLVCGFLDDETREKLIEEFNSSPLNSFPYEITENEFITVWKSEIIEALNHPYELNNVILPPKVMEFDLAAAVSEREFHRR